LVALMVLRSHLLASMAFGPYSDGEITLAQDLWSKMFTATSATNSVCFLPAKTSLEGYSPSWPRAAPGARRVQGAGNSENRVPGFRREDAPSRAKRMPSKICSARQVSWTTVGPP
jgi:hypothetical protein